MRVVVIAHTTGIANDTERLRLKLASGTKVARIARVRSQGSQTFLYELSVLSLTRFPSLARDGDVSADLAKLAREHGLSLGTATERASTVKADRNVATRLGVVVGAQVLRLDRVVCCVDELPVEWRIAFARRDLLATLWSGD